jgi:hypothetical protein
VNAAPHAPALPDGAGGVPGARASRVAWVAWALAGATLVSLAVATRALVATGAGAEPWCALRRISGVPCPTCGLTRSLARLAAGDLAGSLALHPWGAALTAQALGFWVACGRRLAAPWRPRPDRLLPMLAGINAVALAAIWLVRLASGTLP